MPIFNIHSVFCFNDEIDGLFQPHRFAFLVIDHNRHIMIAKVGTQSCLLYTSDAADDLTTV